MAKIPGVKEYLTSFLLGSSVKTKVIVFAHHRAVLDGVEAALAAYGTGKKRKQRLDWMRIDGDTPHSERTRNTHKFQSDPDCRVAGELILYAPYRYILCDSRSPFDSHS